ncbi:protein of unknown function (DUF4188) domain containing protein [Naviculisporaceae sp. PSN 640]
MAHKFTPARVPDGPAPPQRAKYAFINTLKGNFKLTTWLLLGALLHGIATLVLPKSYALLPVVILLLKRTIDTILACYGLTHNPHMDHVLPGRFTAQIPEKDGGPPPTEPAEQDVAVVLLGFRANHPLGMFAPGVKELVGSFQEMLDGLRKDPSEYGFLGSTAWEEVGPRETNNQGMVILYFRSMKHVHAFAEGPAHRKGWAWWNSIAKSHGKYIGIMHEVYHAPKKHWESIYVNFHLTGLGNTVTRVNNDGQLVRPVFSAQKGVLRSSLGRTGHGTGAENDGFEEY